MLQIIFCVKKYWNLEKLIFLWLTSSHPSSLSNHFPLSNFQTIVQYKDTDLVIHPAVRKLLEVKWKLFGRRHAIITNFFNIFYTILATVITFAIAFHPYDQQFTPWKKKWWKIFLSAIFILITLFFWVKVGNLLEPLKMTSFVDVFNKQLHFLG